MASPHGKYAGDQLPEVAPARLSTYATVGPREDYEYFEPPPASPPLPSQPVPQYDVQPQSPTQSYISTRLASDHAKSPQSSALVNDKDRPLSPLNIAQYSEVASSAPEAIPENPGEKEVYRYKAYPVAAPISPPPTTPPATRKRVCGLPKKWFLIIAAVILCAIIAIAVSLGVVLGTKHTHKPQPTPNAPSPTNESSPTPTGDPDYTIGGAYSSEYYSDSGAFNGSGIAVASVNFGEDASLFVFFQTYTGEIKQYITHADGSWEEVTSIATNARNSTPLSASAYIVDEVATWHIFYIDEESYVRQRTSSNSSTFETNIWSDGPLNDLNLKANDADMIGMQACYWGNFYGDTDNNFYDGFNVSQANSTSKPQTGMHLWYATSDASFDQYSWTNGDSQWKKDRAWENMNGRAGVGCQTWLGGTTSYVTLIDLDNTLNIWWKDSNVSTLSTADHPINKWVNTSVAIPNVHPSTSMGYTNYLTYQYSDNTVRGVNVSWAAENTTFFPAAADSGQSNDRDTWEIQTAGVPGTHMSITTLPDVSGGAHLAVFFQNVGDDITMWSRDNSAGGWTSANVPVGKIS